ncbi:MAG: hypothetical protein CMJ58_00925 [Planctomycetaceae bacterium]|nr:hypothetical protein [Planctomycetaceae bacterium]
MLPWRAYCHPLHIALNAKFERSPPVSRALAFGLIILAGMAPSTADAQEWAEKMFGDREHDFGAVARGADTEYRFEITNIYKQEMNIVGVRSSCGCTSPSLADAQGNIVDKLTLKTWEKGYVVAKFNTRTHLGMKGATLTVTFGAPYMAEVQVRVHGNIRGDVVFTPGAVEFGEVDEGVSEVKQVNVVYAGRSSWKIVDVTNDNDMFEVELNEVERMGGRVSYNLLVRLRPDTPAGYIKDELTIVTNDAQVSNQRIPLYVSGHVRPEFSVTPAQLVLGEMSPGAEVTKKIVVRGREPFKILDVTCGEDCFAFQTDSDSRKVHFVAVTFKAGEGPATLVTPITIVTDRGENRGPKFVANATVLPAEEPAAPGPAESDQEETANHTAAAAAL